MRNPQMRRAAKAPWSALPSAATHNPAPSRCVSHGNGIEIHRAHVRHFEDQPQLQMILQIFADAGKCCSTAIPSSRANGPRFRCRNVQGSPAWRPIPRKRSFHLLRRAAARSFPDQAHATARRSSNRTLSAKAPVMILRLSRFATGSERRAQPISGGHSSGSHGNTRSRHCRRH